MGFQLDAHGGIRMLDAQAEAVVLGVPIVGNVHETRRKSDGLSAVFAVREIGFALEYQFSPV